MIEIDVTTHIDASPATVWALLGDPTRMGEWSPECRRVDWVGGSSAPAVGARFRGHNRYGWRRWSTTSTVVAYDENREIGWDVGFGLLPIAHWHYRIDPDPDGNGCTIVESFRDRRTRPLLLLGPMARGVSDVETHNRAGMIETLARVKAEAERRAA